MNDKNRSFSQKVVALATSLIFVAGAAGVSIALAAITFSNSAITGDSSFTNFTGATSTIFDMGSGVNNTLSLQTTNNGPITTGSGLFTIGGILNVANIDRSGTISIGTSSATAINIGKAGVLTSILGSSTVSGLLTANAGLTANGGTISLASSTFANGGSGPVVIDTTGAISIGTSSATGITIGRSGTAVTFPGNASTTGTFTITSASVGALTVTGGGTSQLGPIAISAGTLIQKHLSATSTLTLGTIGSSTCITSAAVAIAGVATGDNVYAAPTAVANGVETTTTTWMALASSTAGNVVLRACNVGLSNITPAAQTWRFDVWQH